MDQDQAGQEEGTRGNESRAGQAAKNLATEGTNRLLKAAKNLATEGTKRLLKQAASKLAESAVANPEIWIPIVVIVAIIVITFSIVVSAGAPSVSQLINASQSTGNNSSTSDIYNQSGAPIGNFGDPNHDFSISGLYSMLEQKDPKNASVWEVIAAAESGNDPNAYNSNSASGNGAYGLFQMNPQGKGNSQYDTGNVPWRQQVDNAIAYNSEIGQSFAYWATRPCSYVCYGDVDYLEKLSQCTAAGKQSQICTSRKK